MPTTETVQTNIPEWAVEYAKRLLGTAERRSYEGYQPYTGQRVAEFNPLQTQAFIDIAGMTPAAQISQATGMAGLAGLKALNAPEYQAAGPQQFYAGPNAAGITSYMSPYMQNVVDVQKQRAVQDYMKQIPGTQFAAARSGARGGTRDALIRSEGIGNLQQQLQGIQATGLQSAYDKAMAQAAQDAALRAQYGLAGSQLGESSRQFGANLGLQNIGQQLAAAGQLGSLGQQQYQQAMGINTAQQGAGAQIQALKQQDLTNQYQQFIEQQQQPFKQLGFFSDILRGIPSGSYSVYQPGGSSLGQIAGLAGGIGTLFGNIGTTGSGTPTTSDRRLKSNIVRVGTHPLGIGVYEYDIWGMRQRGVMADEVLGVMPEAVTMQDNGYMAVFYDKIGGV
jgi:hypothetical protein